MDADGAAVGEAEGTGGAAVVLHVARAHDAARIDVLEAGEELRIVDAHDVGHHVEATPVAHPQHRARRVVLGGGLEHGGEHRDESLEPFYGEALVAEVLRLQELLEDRGPHELIDQRPPIQLRGRGFHPLLNPGAALGIRDVHELGGERAAIGALRFGDPRAFAHELGMIRGRQAAEPVEIGFEIAPAAIGVEDRFRGGVLAHGDGA